MGSVKMLGWPVDQIKDSGDDLDPEKTQILSDQNRGGFSRSETLNSKSKMVPGKLE